MLIIKSSILFLVSTLILTSFGLPLDSFAQTSENQKPEIYKPDRLIVKFKPGVSAEQKNSILSAQNVTKRFGGLVAVDHVNVEIEEKSIFSR